MRKFVVAALLSLLSAGTAHAAPAIGDNLTCSNAGTGRTCDQATAVLGSGVEFTDGILNIDFDTSGFTFSVGGTNTSYDYTATIYRFFDLNNPFRSVSLVSQSGLTGFSASTASVSNGQLLFDLRNTSGPSGASARFALETAGAVPEPASWAMMILGMGATGFVMRRRKVMTRVTYAA